jgi:hypothetical protein
VQQEADDRQYDEDVNESAGDMEKAETGDPGQAQDDRQNQKHAAPLVVLVDPRAGSKYSQNRSHGRAGHQDDPRSLSNKDGIARRRAESVFLTLA